MIKTCVVFIAAFISVGYGAEITEFGNGYLSFSNNSVLPSRIEWTHSVTSQWQSSWDNLCAITTNHCNIPMFFRVSDDFPDYVGKWQIYSNGQIAGSLQIDPGHTGVISYAGICFTQQIAAAGFNFVGINDNTNFAMSLIFYGDSFVGECRHYYGTWPTSQVYGVRQLDKITGNWSATWSYPTDWNTGSNLVSLVQSNMTVTGTCFNVVSGKTNSIFGLIDGPRFHFQVRATHVLGSVGDNALEGGSLDDFGNVGHVIFSRL